MGQETKMDLGKAVLQLTNVVQSLTERLNEVEAQRIKTSGKVKIEVTGTDNPKVIKFVKSIYEKKKYQNSGIASVEVGIVQTTPTGLLRYPIRKTFANGEQKSMALIDFDRETA